MGNKVSYECYCTKCGSYVGSWWHYDWADAPIFRPVKCTIDPAGFPYCQNCDTSYTWHELDKHYRG